MKVKSTNFVTFLTVLFFIFLLALNLTAEEDNQNIDWDNASPSVIHQKLWEGKASSYMNKQLARTLAAQEPMVNTQTNYDVKFYDISIRVDDTAEILYGAVKFVALATEDGVTDVQVDFYNNMTVDSIVEPSSGVLSYSRLANVVTVTLDHAYNTGEQFEFTFYYHGHPTEGGFQAFSFGTHSGNKVISSLSEPYFARTWWPCKDRMDDKADSFHIAITVDTAFYVASNGTLDSTIENGGNTHTVYYSVHYPMVTYLFSVAISKYIVWYDQWIYNNGNDTMPIVNAVYPDQYVYSLSKWNVTPQAISVFSNNYGLYPFVNEKYGQANFTWSGGMEHQTMTSMTGSSFGFSTPVVVHELSHQWWGDMITCKTWGDIWLNEGWASYSEALYYLETEGWQSYHNYMNGMDYTGGGTIYIYDTTSVWNIFGSIVYDKGAWVVHMLRGVLGDSLFFAGVDAYYHSQYQYRAATTEDFRDVFEATTGVDLHWFFDEWIYGEYRPNYRYSYWTEPSDTNGYDVFLYVEQVQTTNPQVFKMPVDFYFDYGGGLGDTVTVTIDQREKLSKLNFPNPITNIELDPSDWVLKYKTKTSWSFKIVTFNDELSVGDQYVPYIDTIETRGASSITTAIISGSLPTGLSIDNNGIISGTPTDTGLFNFTVQITENSFNTSVDGQFSIYVNPTPYLPGDVNSDGDINASDVLYLINYFFLGGPASVPVNAADVNGDCSLDSNDLMYMINYDFKGGPAPVNGCVE